MKSAEACLEEAAKCERFAEIVPSEKDRSLLLSLSEQWKRLAELSPKSGHSSGEEDATTKFSPT